MGVIVKLIMEELMYVNEVLNDDFSIFLYTFIVFLLLFIVYVIFILNHELLM